MNDFEYIFELQYPFNRVVSYYCKFKSWLEK